MDESRVAPSVPPRPERHASSREHVPARRPWPAPVRIALPLGLGLYLLYVLAANVALATPLLRSVIGSEPEKLSVEWTSAWSLVPGTVVLQDFALRLQDRDVQMHLALDRARVRIDLPALATKRFHVTSLRAEGTALRLRTKVDDPRGREVRLAAFPPIEGCADPPVRSARDRAPPEPLPPRSELWTVHVEGIEATVRELWFSELRWVGAGDVSGSFQHAPQRELEVGPARLRGRDRRQPFGEDGTAIAGVLDES